MKYEDTCGDESYETQKGEMCLKIKKLKCNGADMEQSQMRS